MRFRVIAFVWFLALGMSPLAVMAADEACCDKASAACCRMPGTTGDHVKGACDMPCCNEGAAPAQGCCNKDADASAIDILLAMDDGAMVQPMESDHAGRQMATVWFHRPVWIGRNVLLGKYVIEHDTARQARGEPCTHIYNANDTRLPIAWFHCTHIDGERVDRDTVVLQTLPDGSRRFVQFQFAGESAAHGYPTGR